MKRIEANIVRSFRSAKNEISELSLQLNEISIKQDELIVSLKELSIAKNSKKTNGSKKVKVVRSKPKAKTYIASKDGKKFHIKECPYAQNIKPKSAVKFKSKDAALNKSYKPCNCVK